MTATGVRIFVTILWVTAELYSYRHLALVRYGSCPCYPLGDYAIGCLVEVKNTPLSRGYTVPPIHHASRQRSDALPSGSRVLGEC